MLLQEQTQEQTTANLRTPLVGMDAAPPRELAQAIVAIEGREENTRLPFDLESAARTVERLGLEIAPEELLAQVQEQRTQAHQDNVMTKRRRLDRTARMLLGGMVVTSTLALCLAFTTYMLYKKLVELSIDQWQRNEQDARKRAQRVDASDLIAHWKFYGSRENSRVISPALATSIMTANQSYDSVWKYYAQETGFNKAFPNSPYKMSDNGKLLVGPLGWTAMESGHTVQYHMETRNLGGHTMTFITRHAGPNLVRILLETGAAKDITEITVDATSDEEWGL